jgi:hypothetical protein
MENDTMNDKNDVFGRMMKEEVMDKNVLEILLVYQKSSPPSHACTRARARTHTHTHTHTHSFQVILKIIQHLSDASPIKNGLKHSDDLSSLLFNFALEYAIRKDWN